MSYGTTDPGLPPKRRWTEILVLRVPDSRFRVVDLVWGAMPWKTLLLKKLPW